MGGLDKGLVTLRNQPLVGHAIDRFAPQVSFLALNVNRSQDAYATFGLPLVSDEISGFAGPLAGLAAGMQYFEQHCGADTTDWVATIPCDSPFLPLDFVSNLFATATAQRRPIAVARTPSGAQPVFALYQIAVLNSLQTFLATGKRKIDVWTAQHDASHHDFADENAFANINTMAELLTY